MKKKIEITDEIKNKVIEIVNDFNNKVFKTGKFAYYPEFKGNFVYLQRKEYDLLSPVARLKFNGEMNNWDFAIFKWSSEKYDPEEWMFPGSDLVDGTIEGAMKAGLKAYPTNK